MIILGVLLRVRHSKAMTKQHEVIPNYTLDGKESFVGCSSSPNQAEESSLKAP